MFLKQGIFNSEKNKVSHELLAKDKKNLFSKVKVEDKIEYDLILLEEAKEIINSVKEKVNFNVNIETVLTEEFKEVLQEISIQNVVFELLENGLDSQRYKLNKEQNKILHNYSTEGVLFSLDDIPNFMSSVDNFENGTISQVKVDVEYVQKIRNKFKEDKDLIMVNNYIEKLISYLQGINCSQVVFEGIEREDQFLSMRLFLEKKFKNEGITPLFQGYYLETPQ